MAMLWTAGGIPKGDIDPWNQPARDLVYLKRAIAEADKVFDAVASEPADGQLAPPEPSIDAPRAPVKIAMSRR